MKKLLVVLLTGVFTASLLLSCSENSSNSLEESVVYGDEAGIYDTVTFTTAYPVLLVKRVELEISEADTSVMESKKLILVKENYAMMNRYFYFTGSKMDSALLSIKSVPENYCLVIKTLAQKEFRNPFSTGTLLSFSIEKIINHQGG